MRPLPALLAFSLIAGPAIAARHHSVSHSHAAPACLEPSDQTAFEVEALKSELMVTALQCQAHAKYNAFMREYKPAIAREEADLRAFFKRVYGRSSQTQYDEYISNLANAQAEDGVKAGTAFCDNLPNMFDEVMSLQNASQLPQYAQSQPLVQPASYTPCGSTTAVETAMAPASHKSSKRRHHI